MGKFDDYINVTAPIHSATVKGKLGNANEIFLEGDTQNIENEIKKINSRHEELNKKHDTLSSKHESLSRTVQGIATTGGASTANNVTYNNDSSRLNAENTQDAIDELENKKIDKSSIAQGLGTALDKVMSQGAVKTELDKKIDKSSIAQESGEAEDKVMSQKVVSNAIKTNAEAIKTNAEAIKFSNFGSHPTVNSDGNDWLVLDDRNVEVGKVYNFYISQFSGGHKPFINIVEYVSKGDTISFDKALSTSISQIKYFIVIDPNTYVIKEKIEITSGFNSFTVQTSGILIGSVNTGNDIHIDKNYNSSRNTNLYLLNNIKTNADAIKANAEAIKTNAEAIKFSNFGSHPTVNSDGNDWLVLDDRNVEVGKVYNFYISQFSGGRKPFINIVEYVSKGDTISFDKELSTSISQIKYFIVIDPNTYVIKEKIEITSGFNSFTVQTSGILIGSVNTGNDIHIDKNYNSSRNTNLYLLNNIKTNADAIKANAEAIKTNAEAIKFSNFGSHPTVNSDGNDWLVLDDRNVEVGKVYNFYISQFSGGHKPFINIVEYVSKGDTISFDKALSTSISQIKYFIVIDPNTYVIKEKIEITSGFNSFTVQTSGFLIGSVNTGNDIHIDKNYNSSRNTNLYLLNAIKTNAEAVKTNADAIEAITGARISLSLFNKIIFIGDSTSEGVCIIQDFAGKTLKQYSHPSILSRMFGFTAVNIAKGGITTKEFNDSRFNLFESNKENADACFIELGWNDVNWSTSIEELDNDFNTNVLQYGDNYELYKTENSKIANYCQLLKKVLAAKPNIVVFLVISFGLDHFLPRRPTTIYGIKKVAEWASNDVILLDMSNSELIPDSGDGVHFSPVGYAKKASYLSAAINNLSDAEQLKISKRLLKL